jgi:sugar lactone lactonase YvrE
MKSRLAGMVLLALLSPIVALRAQDRVTTLAGQVLVNGLTNGPVTTAAFNDPAALVADTAGNLYIADSQNHVIRKAATNGIVSTFAGQAGTPGSMDGNGFQAQFDTPSGIAIAPNGDFYVSDTGNHTIRKITPAGVVITMAGMPAHSGYTNGPGSAARFNSPLGITVGANDTIYVADSGNQLIRKITSGGGVTTLAGSPENWGTDDGVGSAARFNGPVGVAVDDQGNLFVSDSWNHAIRKITPDGTVSTWAGMPGVDGGVDGGSHTAKFCRPAELVMGRKNNLFVADSGNHVIREVAKDGSVSTVTGRSGVAGAAVGINGAARFFNPYGLALAPDGSLVVADAYNELLRVVLVPFNLTLLKTHANGSANLSWDCVIGRNYQVQYKAALDATSWESLGAPIKAINLTTSRQDEDASRTSQRIYRVVLVQ